MSEPAARTPPRAAGRRTQARRRATTCSALLDAALRARSERRRLGELLDHVWEIRLTGERPDVDRRWRRCRTLLLELYDAL